MGQRLNKKTTLVVDITKLLQEKGLQFPNGGFVELNVKVNHAKDLNKQYGSYTKDVTLDLIKQVPLTPVDTVSGGQQ